MVVAVDPRTRVLGDPVPLLAAHTMPGICHLAVSVQLIDDEGRWLVAQRAFTKRSFAGLWSNSCCTHPFAGEDPKTAAKRRLLEELGVQLAQPLEFVGDFVYRAEDAVSGLVEHEWDHVYVARVPKMSCILNPSEVEAVRFVNVSELDTLLAGSTVTPWFKDVAALIR